jgi:16S rRNA (cytosine1402-N4)-methyltransferase
MTYHKPVLLEESVDGLKIKPGGVYADLTFGGGGHSRKILEKLDNQGRLLAFDQDQDARENVPDDKRISFVHANFRFLGNFLTYYGIEKLDGFLADLGISSHQIDDVSRGFAFRTNAALDMRMNVDSSLTAGQILNEYSEDDLHRIFRDYGEIKNARRFARRIAEARKSGKIEIRDRLTEILAGLIPENKKNKTMAQLYQALRIEVNDELGALRELLEMSANVLKPGGRMVILSYHSIEDRMVKNIIKTGNLKAELKKDFYGNPKRDFVAVNRNVITPGEDEIEANPRARSAKLRIGERL